MPILLPADLQPSQPCNLPRRMIRWNLHIQRGPTIPQILTRKYSTFLANKQCSTVCVAAHVVRADGKIGDLEPFDSVHVEALVENAVLDDRVAIAGGHGTCAEGVPSCFDVACEMLVVYFAVLKWLLG